MSHLRVVFKDQAKTAWLTSTRGVYQPQFDATIKLNSPPFCRPNDRPLKPDRNQPNLFDYYCSTNIPTPLTLLRSYPTLFSVFPFYSGQAPILSCSIHTPLWTVSSCLKRPSLNCLIHFYKRCVSTQVWLICQTWLPFFRPNERPLNQQAPTQSMQLAPTVYHHFAGC